MNTNYKYLFFILIFFSLILRLFLASQLEFGNDEVYYWLYAKFPDISHIDHPPMVGFFIDFFTLNLFFDSELAIRLAAIIPSTLNMYIVFKIGTILKNERIGLIASLLYNLSFYGLIISGLFILPDSPLTSFWLLSFYFFLQILPYPPKKENINKLFSAFFFIGCAIYSKYQAVYLLFGIAIYILIFNRTWLKQWQLYIGLIFPIIAISLIFYWNYKNNFISYNLHSNRISLLSLNFKYDSFLREILGQIVYNNPFVSLMTYFMVISFFIKKFLFEKKIIWFFFIFSFPLILTSIYLSLFRNTLPHWSGVSYLTLIPILALFLSKYKKTHTILIKGFVFLSITLILISFSINKGLFLPTPLSDKKENLNRKNAIMDMYGWKQASKKIFRIIKDKKLVSLPIISERWFPASHIDYYIARPNKMKVYGVGNLNNIHKYYWINKTYPKIGNHALYITDSRNYKNPKQLYSKMFSNIKKIAEIPIKRNGVIVKFVFLYELKKNLFE